MKRTVQKLTLIVAIAAAFTACKKDEDVSIDTSNNGSYRVYTQGNVTTVQNLVADSIIGFTSQGQPYGTGKFTFFSLETGARIASSDSATTKWDLGFRGTTIITNSGTSGPGAGGAFVQVGLFADLNTISNDSIFRVDNGTSYAITTGSNRGWYVYDAANNLVNPIPGRVLAIRTASGKYAKVEIQNYYRGGVTPPASATDAIKSSEQRFFNFRYTFQPNGTKTF